MSDQHISFDLVGHDCPLGDYPCLVVPVGKVDGQLCVVYYSTAGPDLVPISNESKYVIHTANTAKALADFDCGKNGLFAINEESVLIYSIGDEEHFFSHVLSSDNAAGMDPFYRFSLAKETRRSELIEEAFNECVRRLKAESPQFVDQWMATHTSSPPELIPHDVLNRNRRKPSMPILFQQRPRPYIYSVLRQENDLGFPEYDLAAPPRRFFSGIDPIPPSVETSLDGRRLQPVATPCELLNGKLQDRDNWPAHSRRTIARLLAWFLVCEDPQRRLESREVQTLAHQASLVRHVLDSPSLNRVLIADEVGLGKTVEAGLIISELLEKQPSMRIMYFAPARLVRNVHREFARLGLHFRKWTSGDGADANLDDERIIASIHKAAYESNSERVVDAPTWDMLVVDPQ